MREYRKTYGRLKKFIQSRQAPKGQRGVKIVKDSIEIMINNLENLWLEHQALPNATVGD